MSNAIANPYLLGLAASPRENSNSGALLSAALSSAEELGARTEIISLWNQHILPCTGCGFCEADFICHIKDGQAEILEKVLSADAVIFASPVYFYGVPSHAKAFLDRFQPLWEKSRHTVRDFWKPAGLIIVGGSNGQKMPDCVRLPVKYAMQAAGFGLSEMLFKGGYDGEPENLPLPEIQKARELGTKIFENISKNIKNRGEDEN